MLNFTTWSKIYGSATYVFLWRVSQTAYFKTGELIIPAGKNYPYALGLIKGLIRSYVLKSDGTEKTIRLAREKQMTGAAGSVLRNEASYEYLQALEDCRVIQVDVEALRKASRTNIRLCHFYTQAITEAFSESIDRIQFLVTLSPEARYLKILHEDKGLLQRVPQKYLASYLGVSPVSLSRIRARVTKRH